MKKGLFIALSLLQILSCAGAFAGCDTHGHTYDRNWKYNETHHWKEPTCGCDVLSDYAEHVLGDDGFCQVCDKEMAASRGVHYAVLEDLECAETVGFWGDFDQERVSVSEWYNGFPVKRIGDFTFDGCDRLTKITLPYSIIRIGAHAFAGCTALKTIDWKNEVEFIDAHAFAGCSNLEELAIPNSVTAIGEFAFSYCVKLEFVKIPDSVFRLSDGLFLGCENLMEVELGQGVKEIGESTFAHCSKLSKIKIPYGVEKIGKTAFNSCVALHSLVCSKTIKVIGERAFYEQTEIIYYEGNEQDWAKIEIADGYMPKICYYSENEPTVSDGTSSVRYWRYLDGEPTIWEK